MNLASSSFLLKAQSHTKQLSWIHIFFLYNVKIAKSYTLEANIRKKCPQLKTFTLSSYN